MIAAPVCAWCREHLRTTAKHQRFCSQKCRQWAFRVRRRRTTLERAAQPMRFAYADPPYPGLAKKYYGDQPTYAGEVDHRELIASLSCRSYDGWALSTSMKALRDVLPLCPPEARVCPWIKPGGVPPRSYGGHNKWEPLIVVPGRELRPGFRDWLYTHPARGGGDLPGRKPVNFCTFLFQQLGMLAGDDLVDLFPGSGVVGRAWSEYSSDPSRAAAQNASARSADDASSSAPSDACPPSPGDASARARSDACRPGRDDAADGSDDEYSRDAEDLSDALPRGRSDARYRGDASRAAQGDGREGHHG